MTKQQWLPYFELVGIDSPLAFELMPVVGLVDIFLASISTVVQMTPFRFEPPARILDRRDLRLLCFHLR